MQDSNLELIMYAWSVAHFQYLLDQYSKSVLVNIFLITDEIFVKTSSDFFMSPKLLMQCEASHLCCPFRVYFLMRCEASYLCCPSRVYFFNAMRSIVFMLSFASLLFFFFYFFISFFISLFLYFFIS